MMKLINFIFAFILFFSIVSGANVIVDSNVGLNQTYFKYSIKFQDSDSSNSFSIEKPRNSILISAKDGENKSLFYSSAGDFYIFKVNSPSILDYKIEFKSISVSDDLVKNNVIKIYTNFNFPVDNLKFKLNLDFDYSNIEDIFPKDYVMQDKQIVWDLDNVEKDSSFMVSFDNVFLNNDLNNSKKVNNSNSYYIGDAFFMGLLNYFISNPLTSIFILLVIVLLVVIYFYRKTMRNLLNIKREVLKKELKDRVKLDGEDNLNKDQVNGGDNLNLEGDDLIGNVEDEVKEETFNEFVSKYLTDNELEVVQVVKNNEGLIQSDILSEIDGLTKSNLSKIITKLDSKKILKRIRVGKVNKIYLGDKLEKYKHQ